MLQELQVEGRKRRLCFFLSFTCIRYKMLEDILQILSYHSLFMSGCESQVLHVWLKVCLGTKEASHQGHRRKSKQMLKTEKYQLK